MRGHGDVGAFVLAACVLAVPVLGAGCQPETEVSSCTPNRARACDCPDGSTGAQTCTSEGEWGNCSCRGDASFSDGADGSTGGGDATGGGGFDAVVDADAGDGGADPRACAPETQPTAITPRRDYDELEDHYVSPDGSADAAGTESDPWSVAAAEKQAGPGDVVHFLAGTYSQTIEPPSGSEEAPVVFRSRERHAAKLDGDGEFQLENTDHVHLQGFRFEKGDWVTLKSSDHIVVRDNFMVGSPDKNTRFFMENANHVEVLNNVMREGGEHNGFIGFPEPRDQAFHHHLVAGNSFTRSGHNPAGYFFEFEKTAWRGNVFHNVIGRNGGLVGGREVVWEHNTISSAFDGPDSAGPTGKFTVQDGIYRFNKLYRNWGTPVVVSPYSEWNGPAGPIRVYNNVFAAQKDARGFRIFDRSESFETVAASFQNNIFDASTSGKPQLYIFGGVHNEGTVLDFTSNLFDGSPAVRYGDSKLSVAEAESQHSDLFSDNVSGSAGFEAPEAGDLSTGASGDAVDGGSPLTQTSSAGTGKTVPVEDARYFHDGFGMEQLAADPVRVGDQVARVTDVSWEKGELTLDRAVDWDQGDPVGLPWSGSSPDMGVYEGGEQFAQVEIEAPMKAQVGESVSFEAEMHGSIDVREMCWQFGDGEGACGSSVQHTYEEPYDYGVRLRVVDCSGRVYWGTWYLFASDSATKTYSTDYRDNQVEKFDNLDNTD